MKKHTLIRNLLIDLLITGVALVVFALFHHVLPRQQQSMGIVIPNPIQQEETGSNSGLALPEDAVLIASAGISDSATLSAKGGRQQGGGRESSDALLIAEVKSYE